MSLGTDNARSRNKNAFRDAHEHWCLHSALWELCHILNGRNLKDAVVEISVRRPLWLDEGPKLELGTWMRLTPIKMHPWKRCGVLLLEACAQDTRPDLRNRVSVKLPSDRIFLSAQQLKDAEDDTLCHCSFTSDRIVVLLPTAPATSDCGGRS